MKGRPLQDARAGLQGAGDAVGSREAARGAGRGAGVGDAPGARARPEGHRGRQGSGADRASPPRLRAAPREARRVGAPGPGGRSGCASFLGRRDPRSGGTRCRRGPRASPQPAATRGVAPGAGRPGPQDAASAATLRAGTPLSLFSPRPPGTASRREDPGASSSSVTKVAGTPRGRPGSLAARGGARPRDAGVRGWWQSVCDPRGRWSAGQGAQLKAR